MRLPMNMRYLMRRQCEVVVDVVSSLESAGFDRCLELGCSVGDALPILAESFQTVVGVEISKEKARIARGKIRGHGDVVLVDCPPNGRVRYPFEESGFDAVVSFSLLHHLDPGNQVHVLEEATRLVKPGGAVVFLEYNPVNPLAILTLLFGDEDAGARPLWRRTAKERLARAGLEPIDDGYVLFFPGSLARLARFERSLRALPLGGKYFVAGTKR